MSDIVERLRAFIIDFTVSAHHPQICTDAADEIKRLRRERVAMRRALEFFAKPQNWNLNGACDPNSGSFRGIEVAEKALSIPDERGEG